MKSNLTILLTTLTFSVFGQNKYEYVHFNKLTEISGTKFVIASIDYRNKISEARNEYLLFIDTKTGSTTQVDFSEKGYLSEVVQIKIDDLDINKIIVVAKTVDLDGKAGINWSDPHQIFILSVDGTSMKQLTEDKFFTQTWTVNRQTGMIIITGHYDSNENGKFDRTDKNEILIFDLKTLELKTRI